MGDIKISLKDVLKVALKQAKFIIIIIAVFTIGAYLYTSYFTYPSYTCYASMIVNSSNLTNTEGEDNNTFRVSDITISARLATSYISVLNSTAMMDLVKNSSYMQGYNISAGALRSMVTFESDSEFITVTVTAYNAQLAQDLANAVIECAPDFLVQKMWLADINVIDAPSYPSVNAVSKSVNTLKGFLAGVALSILLVLAIVLMDNTVKDEDDFTSRYGVSVLGTIPDFAQNFKGGYRYAKKQK